MSNPNKICIKKTVNKHNQMRSKKAEMEHKSIEMIIMLILCLVAIAIVTMLVINTYKSALGEDVSGKVSYWYLENKNFKNPTAVITTKTNEMRFIKTDTSVEINTKTSIQTLTCLKIPTAAKISDQKIYIEPAMGAPEDEKTFYLLDLSGTGRTVKEYEEAKKTANNVRLKLLQLLATDKNVIVADQQNIKLDERKKNIDAVNPNLLISLQAGNPLDANQNEIVAIVNPASNESKKLACMMLNSIISADFAQGYDLKIRIVEEANPLLSDKYPGVILQIGNMKSESGTRLFIENWGLSEAISSGISTYYSN